MGEERDPDALRLLAGDVQLSLGDVAELAQGPPDGRRARRARPATTRPSSWQRSRLRTRLTQFSTSSGARDVGEKQVDEQSVYSARAGLRVLRRRRRPWCASPCAGEVLPRDHPALHQHVEEGGAHLRQQLGKARDLPEEPIALDRVVGVTGRSGLAHTHPRSLHASATRLTETRYAASRMFTLCRSCIAYTSCEAPWSSSHPACCRPGRGSSSSCRRSAPARSSDTVTPPAFARKSGMTNTPFLDEDRIRLRRRGSVGQLADDLRLDARGVGVRDHVLQGRGEEHRDVQLQELLVGDGLGAREPGEASLLLLVVDQRLARRCPWGCTRRPANRRRPRASGPGARSRAVAANWPALPKPWMAMGLPLRSMPSFAAASRVT